ncbi:ergothioneine biosynthesis protein EgtB [Sediminitomix flava]|uniref:Ergothioneine biosynthesis protein EgtB n=1 Tax=Sediminitomix flava TaxID=379075 RepID=A0A315ZCL1_SEDFL|nr:ergothioneine biosynthesis protein EgtB [Sediminitomix flava]PWJ42558.1 ergothioneine biosynthesis protein EgtB [Sediminitomix flava]
MLETFKRIRKQSVGLCQSLKIEDLVMQLSEEVRSPKWHLGHTTWYFEKYLLTNYIENYKPYHPLFEYTFRDTPKTIFAQDQEIQESASNRPTLENVLQYRKYVELHMSGLILEYAEDKHFKHILNEAIHHELKHQELMMTNLKTIMASNPLLPEYSEMIPTWEKRANYDIKWIEVPEGVYQIGHQSDDFSYDNETGVHKTFLHAYRIQDRLVTNREYLEFMADDGYKREDLWLKDGWSWVTKYKVKAPLYWLKMHDKWKYYTMYGLRNIDLDLPVTHISFYEAEAFARWKGLRLPSEFEWEVACQLHTPSCPSNTNFLDHKRFIPVGENGHAHFWGDAWEWTNSAFLAYPFKENKELTSTENPSRQLGNKIVLRGGSCLTPKSHIRLTYRNYSFPEKRWIFNGIRLAESM